MKEREGGPIFTECLLWAGVVLSAFHVLSSKNFDKVAIFYPYHFMDEETEMQSGWLTYPSPTADKWLNWDLIPHQHGSKSSVTFQHKMLSFWPSEKEKRLCSTWRLLGVLEGLSVPIPSSHPFSRGLSCTCFSLQRNPYCTWEGDLAEGCSEPDWDQHWRRSPVLSLLVYCPGIEYFGGGREVLEGASHLPTWAWQRFMSPLCTADSSFSSEGLPRTPTVSRSALVFLYHFSLFFSFSALITICTHGFAH